MKLEADQGKLERVKARCSQWIEEVVTSETDVPILFVKKAGLVEFLRSVKEDEGLEFNFLSDLTAYDDNPPLDKIVDYGLGAIGPETPGAPRFAVVYQLLSLQTMDRIRVKVRVAEGEEAPSVVSLWKAANWLEREVYDMYGIRFSDHPDLRRIMLDERWVGHPQRKDYPIKKYQRFEGASTMESLGLEVQK